MKHSCRHGEEEGGTKRSTCWGNCWLRSFFFFSCLLAIFHSSYSRPDYIWHGWGWLVTWQGCCREGKGGAGGRMSGGVMNMCTGLKWQFNESWAYRLQDVKKTHRGRRLGRETVLTTDQTNDKEKLQRSVCVCVHTAKGAMVINNSEVIMYLWCRKIKGLRQ